MMLLLLAAAALNHSYPVRLHFAITHSVGAAKAVGNGGQVFTKPTPYRVKPKEVFTLLCHMVDQIPSTKTMTGSFMEP